MARDNYVVDNKLRSKAREADRLAKIRMAIVGTVASIGLGIAVTQQLGLVIAGVFFVFTLLARSPDERYKAGADGEDRALALMRQLPSTYTVFNQLDIPNPRSRTGVNEADLVVCGPRAIFVIEVKGNNGQVECSDQSPTWKVTKIGRGGTEYEASMRNPVAQCKNLVWCLGEHLKASGAKPWIQGLVVFTHPKVELVRNGHTAVPVLLAREVLDYINSFEQRSTPEVLNRATRVIAAMRGEYCGETRTQDRETSAGEAPKQGRSEQRIEPRL